jgi:uncharacterized protein (TIGR02145 family)
MKYKCVRLVSLLIGIPVLLTISSCKKDQNSPDNPTNGKSTAAFNTTATYGTLKDQDGNIYKTVEIGTQIWMAENLRTTKYRNGDPIPEITDITSWRILNTGAYCNYENIKNNDTIATFGRLYNQIAATDSRNICPSGWHVPSDGDWTNLITYLGGNQLAGGKLRESGYRHWAMPNSGATNANGFTALPGGFRNYDGTFQDMGNQAFWWCSTEHDAGSNYYRFIDFQDSYIYRSWSTEPFGFSIRCVKD